MSKYLTQLVPVARTDFLGYLLMYRYARTVFLGNTLAHVLVNMLAFLLSNLVTVGLRYCVAVLLGDMLAVL